MPASEGTGVSLGPSSAGSSPHWMQEWEERQRRQLEQHEETTRQLVEAMRGELLEKLERIEQSQPQARGRKAGAKPKARSSWGKQKERMEAPTLAIQTNPTGDGDMKRNESWVVSPSVSAMWLSSMGSSKPKRASTCANMNAAMLSAVGAGKDFDDTPKTPEFRPGHTLQVKLFDLVHHRFFEVSSGTIILIYTAAVGAMSDLDMRAAIGKQESPEWRYFVDLAFTAVFLVELILRIVAEGPFFLSRKNKERTWNIFDFFMASIGLLDAFSVFNVNLSFVRILRTVRAIRVLRVIRIFRFFKDLRLMVASILCSLWSLTCAFLLLTAAMYVCAVVLLQGASEYLHSLNRGEVPEDLALSAQLFEDFGDILKSVYSLTQAVSGGRSWGEYAAPFIKISPWYGLLFTMFVVFVIFGLLNVLTGVFVESTSAVASYDKELVIQDEMSRNESAVSQIRALFQEVDHDESGTITMKELKRNLSDPRVKAYFSSLQLDVNEAAGLFELLDRDESGAVSIEEFVMTCMKLKGTARSIDLATMLCESKRLYSTIRKFMTTIDQNLKEIEARLPQDSGDELG